MDYLRFFIYPTAPDSISPSDPVSKKVNPGLAEHAGKGIGWHMAMSYATQIPPPVTVSKPFLSASCLKLPLLTPL